ncbi:MAG TPA: CinA family protein [Nocardioidaceae bacterium]|nr:CinA family protein [Nocardioidaceae bacterium]
MTDSAASLPEAVVAAARDRSATIATAESLTGGLVCAALVDVPGASDVVRGGVVAYAADVKVSALGVPADLVDRVGTVHQDVARAMAAGARERLRATHAVATTGVAGPDPSEGRPVGTVHIAVAGPSGVVDRAYAFDGDRPAVRRQACRAALALLAAALADTA